MKRLILFLTLVVLLVPAAHASAGKGKQENMVVLTAADVHTAIDIETAIQKATNWGQHSGLVVLDGSKGPFTYEQAEGNDYAINLFYSNITIRGVNNPILLGIDGFNFDGMALRNITIEKLTILCPAECISGGDGAGLTEINIRGNLIQAGGTGIQLSKGGRVNIQENTIQGGWAAINLVDITVASIKTNHLAGFIPVVMQSCLQCDIVRNNLLGQWEGILIISGPNSNHVQSNSIMGVEASGISLEGGTSGNEVINNSVLCTPGAQCETVHADQETWANNKIHGNRP